MTDIASLITEIEMASPERFAEIKLAMIESTEKLKREVHLHQLDLQTALIGALVKSNSLLDLVKAAVDPKQAELIKLQMKSNVTLFGKLNSARKK